MYSKTAATKGTTDCISFFIGMSNFDKYPETKKKAGT